MSRLPKPAQYLLRFDDLCPTVAADSWRQCREMIEEFGLRPILAVVPENCDADLECSPPDPDFWAQMRILQAGGASIGLHGYRHLCASNGRSLLGYAGTSEFAGVCAQQQREWVRAGLEELHRHGLHAQIWVAPRHGFDRRTLRVLGSLGITVLSDGLALRPHTRSGIVWIPQQLWAPVEKSAGVWTICVHPNTARLQDLCDLRAFLLRHAAQFTSVDRALAQCRPSPLALRERVFARVASGRLRLARAWSRIRSQSVESR